MTHCDYAACRAPALLAVRHDTIEMDACRRHLAVVVEILLRVSDTVTVAWLEDAP